MNCYFWGLLESLHFLPLKNKTKIIKLPVKNGVDILLLLGFFSQKCSYFLVNYLNEILKDWQFSQKKNCVFSKNLPNKSAK